MMVRRGGLPAMTGRQEMTFEPILDRSDATDFKIIRSVAHQVFGRFSGGAVLDDGRGGR